MELGPGERLSTPTDERGLVDIPATINLVKGVAPRNYQWAPNLSVHHFYWPGADYEEMGDTARAFRELPIHKGLVLREWENLLHMVTAPSPMPDEDVMAYRVEAWRVAHDLFASVSQAVAWEKRTRRREALIRRHPEILPAAFNGEDRIGQEVLGDILDKHFQGAQQHLERAAQIPPEHRLFDLEAGHIQLAQQLGELVVPSSVLLVRAIAA
jgi:hypothetical protein